MSGWVDLHRNYFFLKNEDVLWLSEQDGWRHIYLHSKNGKKIRQITQGNWEVKNIIHFDYELDGNISKLFTTDANFLLNENNL